MKEAIKALTEGRDLSRGEAERIAELILTGQATEAQIGAVLTALRMKGETVDEILGFATVLRQKANTISPKLSNYVHLVETWRYSTCSFNNTTSSGFVQEAA